MELYRDPPLLPPQMTRQLSASSSSTNLPPDFQHHQPPYDSHGDSFAANRMRKLTQRRSVDYTSTVIRYIQVRMWQRDSRDRTALQPTRAAAVDLLPPVAYADNPSTSFAVKFVHTSSNKNRCSINRVLWTPNGRRLITGSQNGEFTLWNGQSFNFEMILQAHEQAVRSMIWSHNENWMVTGDDGGAIKYWQNNMNHVKANKSAHKESVQGLSFCKTDLKFCSCSDDTTVKVWDFARCQEEKSLTGHGWDVKSVDWHPTKSLLVSGSKDNIGKLWDAKSGKELCSFHGHKNTVLCVKWNDNGNWVLTASKDQIIKLYDIRTMKELQSFHGHRKDITALAWHPFHEEYFVSGSYDGSIFHWLVGHETPQIEVTNAHANAVWDLAWHPLGYILCSNMDCLLAGFLIAPSFCCFGEQNPAFTSRPAANFQVSEGPALLGAFPPGLSRNEGTIPGVGIAMPLFNPSLDTSQGEQKQGDHVSMPMAPPPLPPGPHPSLLQPQPYQHNLQQMLQQGVPQQMSSYPQPPSNMPQLQPPSNMSLPHPYLARPPQMSPHYMPSNIPSSMPGSLSMPPTSLPMPMGMQNATNQMVPQMQQGQFMGMNPMQSGSMPSGGLPPVGSFPNGMSNMQGPPSTSGSPMYPPSSSFNRPQSGQMQMMQGLNPYQPGNPSGMPQPPLRPPGPPPQ